jgi:hypothetical protein
MLMVEPNTELQMAMSTIPVVLELRELVKNEVDNVSEVAYNKHIATTL